MKAQILTVLFVLSANNSAWAGSPYPGLQVDVSRAGTRYTLRASFDTPLSRCAAYHYLTDYEAARLLPGVVESRAVREADGKVRVDRTADEQILFMRIRLHSVMAYTEQAPDGIAFNQLSGDSKLFQGTWRIEPNRQGSTLRFQGQWEPETLIPLFIIDHFARHGLLDKFSAIAQLAQERNEILSVRCAGQSN
jgi:ribosome-associated toxin RatA of RatAB toxin-antitoxin module